MYSGEWDDSIGSFVLQEQWPESWLPTGLLAFFKDKDCVQGFFGFAFTEGSLLGILQAVFNRLAAVARDGSFLESHRASTDGSKQREPPIINDGIFRLSAMR
jgi:hypothetical protein